MKDQYYYEACENEKELYFHAGIKQTDEQVEKYAEKLRKQAKQK